MHEKPDSKESNKALIITGIVIALFVIALFTNGFGLFSEKKSPNYIDASLISIGESPVIGKEEAQLVIYEFSDFSCPYCAAAAGYNSQIIQGFKNVDSKWEAPVPKIISSYVKTGKVKFVYKYYPGHGEGVPAHLVGYALDEQDLFWEFHDKVFAQQGNADDLEKMKDIARDLGADMEKLEEFLNSNKGNFLLQSDIQMGQKIKVSGTPTFIINGRLIAGAYSYADMKVIIDEELAGLK